MTQRKPRPRICGALIVLALLAAGCAAGVLPAVHSEAERLNLARRMMEQRKYASAIELLKGYVQNNAGSASVDEAIYLLGDAYLKTREWPLASVEFERLVRDYPESDSTPAAAFRLGEAMFGQARPPDFDQEYTVKAIEQWRSYRRDYPGHWLNDEADRRIAAARNRLGRKLLDTGNLYLKLKLPAPARSYFERIEAEFEPSLLRGEAELGIAECDARLGRVDEALERLAAIEREHAGQPLAAKAAEARARLERKHRK
jgi:outer membrane protein assembly factor BamD